MRFLDGKTGEEGLVPFLIWSSDHKMTKLKQEMTKLNREESRHECDVRSNENSERIVKK